MLECLRLFQEHPDVLADWQRRFRYMLVDEYQDTNVAQYLWLRILAQRTPERPQPNLCCVGDDDQSIYGWRGAEVDNILRFDKDFPGAFVVRLERNYRSTGHILGAASGLIARNADRLGDLLLAATLAVLGAPPSWCVAAAALTLLHEYLRARANAAGMPGPGAVTVAERPTRLVLVAVAALGTAVLPGGTPWTGWGWATVCAVGWIAIGAVGLVHLAVGVARGVPRSFPD